MIKPSLSCFLALTLALALACGSEEPDVDPLPEFEETTPGILPAADESTFDVVWKPEVLVASLEEVMSDIEDLNPADGVFRVQAGSPLLEGVSVGNIVVWPQVGLLEILSLTPDGDRVGVETQWAAFSEAMTSADIQFEHVMRDMGPGSVIGVAAPSVGPTIEGGVQMPLFDSPRLRFSNGGASYNNGDWRISLSAMNEQATFRFDSSNNAFASHVEATARGLRAQGSISLLDEPDATAMTSITFPNIDVSGTLRVRFEQASTTTSVIPPATMVFPFMLGPLPAFVAVQVRVRVDAAASLSAYIQASADFDMSGNFTLTRGPDGASISGGITRFEQSAVEIEGSTSVTAGIGIDVDAPRVSFGLGRPGIATAALFGTVSSEMTANVMVDPSTQEFCTTVSLGSSVLYGGEVSALGFAYTTENMLGGLRAPVTMRGALCN